MYHTHLRRAYLVQKVGGLDEFWPQRMVAPVNSEICGESLQQPETEHVILVLENKELQHITNHQTCEQGFYYTYVLLGRKQVTNHQAYERGFYYTCSTFACMHVCVHT